MIIYLSIITTIILLTLLVDCLINKQTDEKTYSLTILALTVITIMSLVFWFVYGIYSLMWWLILYA